MISSSIIPLLGPVISCMRVGLRLQHRLDIASDLGQPEEHTLLKHLQMSQFEYQLNNSSLGKLKWGIRLLPHAQIEYGPTNFEFEPISSKAISATEDIMCAGGGIDSTLALLYLKALCVEAPTLIHVNYGIPYNHKELKALTQITKFINKEFKYRVQLIEVALPEGLLGPLTPDKLGKGYIIPARNLLLATIGARFGQNIYIVANYRKADDVGAPDKSRRFYGEMTELLSLSCKSLKRVMSPFLHLSKRQTIEWAITRFGKKPITDLLALTTSCYDDTKMSCGVCYSCFKRYIATRDILDLPFDVHPTTGPQFEEFTNRELAKGRTIHDVD